MKWKDCKNCLCQNMAECAEPVRKLCRYGHCTLICCPQCGGMFAGWGPVACPCKKNENGTLRWYKYPDMDKKTPVAVKLGRRTRGWRHGR